MTKKDLANLTGLSPAYLTMITKQNTNPTLNVMEKIADALNVPLPYLLLNNDLPKSDEIIHQSSVVHGYEYVSVLLPSFQAHVVKKWGEKAEEEVKNKFLNMP